MAISIGCNGNHVGSVVGVSETKEITNVNDWGGDTVAVMQGRATYTIDAIVPKGQTIAAGQLITLDHGAEILVAEVESEYHPNGVRTKITGVAVPSTKSIDAEWHEIQFHVTAVGEDWDLPKAEHFAEHWADRVMELMSTENRNGTTVKHRQWWIEINIGAWMEISDDPLVKAIRGGVTEGLREQRDMGNINHLVWTKKREPEDHKYKRIV